MGSRTWALAIALLVLSVSAGWAAQTCKYASIPATAPASRFTDNGNGTVTDRATDLQWKRCAEGQTWSGGTCTGTAAGHTWQGALQLAEGASYAGKTDWRLPNLKELDSIVEEACYAPAIDLAVFPGTPSDGFWSSSPFASSPDFAWVVSFSYGDGGSVAYKDVVSHVRLVRGGQ